VYFGPLNSNNNHFTLLEINEREQKIYHYDSMASQGIVDGRAGDSSPHGLDPIQPFRGVAEQQMKSSPYVRPHPAEGFTFLPANRRRGYHHERGCQWRISYLS
jgi:hypothetical protein